MLCVNFPLAFMMSSLTSIFRVRRATWKKTQSYFYISILFYRPYDVCKLSLGFHDKEIRQNFLTSIFKIRWATGNKKHQITSTYLYYRTNVVCELSYQHLQGQMGNLKKIHQITFIYTIDLMLCVNFPLAFMIKKIDRIFLPASSGSSGQPGKKKTQVTTTYLQHRPYVVCKLSLGFHDKENRWDFLTSIFKIRWATWKKTHQITSIYTKDLVLGVNFSLVFMITK